MEVFWGSFPLLLFVPMRCHDSDDWSLLRSEDLIREGSSRQPQGQAQTNQAPHSFGWSNEVER